MRADSSGRVVVLVLLATFSVVAARADVVLVKDIWPGVSGSEPEKLFDVNGALQFVARDEVHGRQWWRSDGTEPGTAVVKVIGAGVTPIMRPIVVDGTLFFYANDGIHGIELWKSDGTELGTMLVKDIATGDGWNAHFCYPSAVLPVCNSMGDAGGTLHMPNGARLWKSDGTEEGTSQVTTIVGMEGAKEPTGLDGTLFFSARSSHYVDEEPPDSVVESPLHSTLEEGGGSTNPTVAEWYTYGEELWKTDGTEPGTVMVKNINARTFFGSSGSSYPHELIVSNGILFFVAADGWTGNELWRSDGTEDGTAMVKEIWPGESGSDARALVDLNDIVFFAADDGNAGFELWKSDGTPEGTVLVKDLRPGAEGSSPEQLTVVGGLLFFAATVEELGRELWVSDGTEAGTVPVSDICPGDCGSSPAELAEANGKLFFAAESLGEGREPWQSDGTVAGTFLLADLAPGLESSSPHSFTAAGPNVYFAATTLLEGIELWAVTPPCEDDESDDECDDAEGDDDESTDDDDERSDQPWLRNWPEAAAGHGDGRVGFRAADL